MRKVFLWFCILLVLTSGCKKHPADDETGTPKAKATPTATAVPNPKVDYAEVVRRSIPTTAKLTGGITADDPVQVSAQISGPIDQVYVRQGDSVVRGQTLFTLSNDNVQLQVLEDKAGLVQAYAKLGLRPGETLRSKEQVPSVKKARSAMDNKKKSYEQYQELRKQELISDQQLDDQKQLYQSSKADYESALEQVDQDLAAISVQKAKLDKDAYQSVFTRVTSPVNGAVEQVNISPGGTAQSGSPAITLIDTSELFLSVAVPQELVPRVAQGRVINGTVTTVPPIRVTARVERLDPTLNSDTRTLTVQARILDASSVLRPGMFAEVEFETGQSVETLLVPQSGVLTQAGLSYVYLLEQQGGEWVSKELSVSLGETEGAWVEVTGALKVGDKVAASNIAALKDKQPVDLGKALPAYGTGQ